MTMRIPEAVREIVKDDVSLMKHRIEELRAVVASAESRIEVARRALSMDQTRLAALEETVRILESWLQEN